MPRKDQVDFCDCGAVKRISRAACESCSFLDGVTDTAGEIIAALRTVTPLSTPELARAIGRERGAVLHSVRRLLKNGRLKRVEREVEKTTIAGFGLGGGRASFYELVSP